MQVSQPLQCSIGLRRTQASQGHAGSLLARPAVTTSSGRIRSKWCSSHLRTGSRRQPTLVQARREVDVATLPKDLVSSNETLVQEGNTPIPWLLGRLLIIGLTFGSLFQFAHNEGFLPVYDVWAFQIGPLHHCGTIPFVLAPIWLLYGYLQPLVDTYLDDSNTRKVNEWASSLTFVGLTWVALAAHFILSDYLYLNNFPHWQCSVILGIGAAAIYKAFDNTRGGLLLGALLAVGAPLGEMFIVNVLHWWHYERPDINGVCHWTGWCYAIYSIGVGNVGRYLVQQRKKERLGTIKRQYD